MNVGKYNYQHVVYFPSGGLPADLDAVNRTLIRSHTLPVKRDHMRSVSMTESV